MGKVKEALRLKIIKVLTLLTLRDITWNIPPPSEKRPYMDFIIGRLVRGRNINVVESFNEQGYSKELKYIIQSNKGNRFIKLSDDRQVIKKAKQGAKSLKKLFEPEDALRNQIVSEVKISKWFWGKLFGLHGISYYPIRLGRTGILDNLKKYIADHNNVVDIKNEFLNPVFDHQQGVLGFIYKEGQKSNRFCYEDLYPYNEILPGRNVLESRREACFDDSELEYLQDDPIGEFEDLKIRGNMQGTPRGDSIRSSQIHGDLNLGNILRRGYLIDFDHVGEGHVAFDLAKLEIELKRHFVSRDLKHIEYLIKFEERLHTNGQAEDWWSPLTKTCFEVIKEIRKYARLCEVSTKEYLYAVIFSSIASLKYKQPYIRHRHRSAFVSASIALTHLDIFEEIKCIPHRANLIVGGKKQFKLGELDRTNFVWREKGDDVTWKVDPNIGTICQGLFKAREPGEAEIKVEREKNQRTVAKVKVEQFINPQIQIVVEKVDSVATGRTNVDIEQLREEESQIEDMIEWCSMNNVINTTVKSIQIPVHKEREIRIKLAAVKRDYLGETVSGGSINWHLSNQSSNVKFDTATLTVSSPDKNTKARLKATDNNSSSAEVEVIAVGYIKVELNGKEHTGEISADFCADNKCKLTVVRPRGVEGDVEWLCNYIDNKEYEQQKELRAWTDRKAKTPSEDAGGSESCLFTRTTAGIWEIQAKLDGIAPIGTSIEVNLGKIDDFEIGLSPNSDGQIRNRKLKVPKESRIAFDKRLAWDEYGNLVLIPEKIANNIQIKYKKGMDSNE